MKHLIEKIKVIDNDILITYTDEEIKLKSLITEKIDFENMKLFDLFNYMFLDEFFSEEEKNFSLPSYEIYKCISENRTKYNIINNSLSIVFILKVINSKTIVEDYNFIKTKIIINYIKILNLNYKKILEILEILEINEKDFFKNYFFKNKKINYNEKTFFYSKYDKRMRYEFNANDEFKNNNLIIFNEKEYKKNENVIEINNFEELKKNLNNNININVNIEKIKIEELVKIFKYLNISKILENKNNVLDEEDNLNIDITTNIEMYPIVFTNIYQEKINKISKSLFFIFNDKEEKIIVMNYIYNILHNNTNIELIVLNKNNYLSEDIIFFNDYYDISYFFKI